MDFDELIDFSQYVPEGTDVTNTELQNDQNQDVDNDDDSNNQDDPYKDIFNSDDDNNQDQNNNDGNGDNDDDDDEPKDLISMILKDKGYSNPDEIQILDENGEVENVKFSDLSIEEQRQILSAPDFVLSDDEIETINFLRQNNTTLKDLVAYREQLAVDNAKKELEDQNFIVNNATDDQLFLADLKSKYPNLTDDELLEELEDAKYNEEIFNKKVQSLREQYKQIEEQTRKEKEEAARKQDEDNWNQAYNTFLGIARDTDTLYSMDLDDQDKDDVLRFLLERDATGKTGFLKLLDDPKSLFHLAWFATKGGQAFTTIHQFYQKQLDTAKRDNKQAGRTSSIRKPSNRQEDKYDMNKFFSK